jgi:putative membrane protein insertion efficiency factor
MNGPPEAKPRSPAGNPLETSVVRIALMGAIDFYKKRISPIGASRCGFHPSCSAFALQAVREKGVFLGVMMTGDRLTRCNIFKGPGPDYLLLPDGRLFDPVSGNLLSEP